MYNHTHKYDKGSFSIKVTYLQPSDVMRNTNILVVNCCK